MQYTLAHHSGDLEEAPETVDAAVSWCPGMTAAPPAAPRPHPWHGSHPRGDTPEVLACNALVSPNSAGVCLDAVTVVMPFNVIAVVYHAGEGLHDDEKE